jgi:sRNA-binding carbon storage regulator CsrA
VHRKEVYESIKRENVAASMSQIPPPDVLKRLLG